MTDKIRIVGDLGDDAQAKVETFAATLTGVQTVSFLRSGIEQLDQSQAAEEGAEEPAAAS